MASAHADWVGDAVITTADQDLLNHVLEETYHLLCADPAKNLSRGLERAARAALGGTHLARQWAHSFSDAARDTDSPIIRRWAQLLDESIQNEESLVRYLSCFIDSGKLPDKTLLIALLKRAEAYRSARFLNLALIDYSRALDLDSQNVEALVADGRTYEGIGRHDAALVDLGRAIELGSQNALHLVERAFINQSAGNNDDALADFERALDLDPRTISALGGRSEIYMAAGRNDEALADCSRAIEIDPLDPSNSFFRGQTYKQLERYEEAVIDYSGLSNSIPSMSGPSLAAGTPTG